MALVVQSEATTQTSATTDDAADLDFARNSAVYLANQNYGDSQIAEVLIREFGLTPQAAFSITREAIQHIK